MHDASPAGFGIVSARLHPEEVAELGAHNERWRFRKEYLPVAARRNALAQLDPFSNMETAKPMVPIRRAIWSEAKDFPEVPLAVLRKERWREAFAGKWKSSEPIHMLEGQAAHLSLRRQVRKMSNHDRRVFFLSDSLCCTLVF